MLKHLTHYGKLLLGSAIYALGFSFFFFPNGLVTGGITGIAMILNYMTGTLPVGTMVIIMNIPVFLVGFWKLGLRFMIDSAISMVVISILIDLLEIVSVPLTNEPLLAALFGGLAAGFGLGLAFSTGATTGGSDIIVRLLRKRYQYMNIGQLVLIIDAIVLVAFALIFKNYDLAMISVIAIYTSTKIIDAVLYGINYGKVVFIISDRYEDVGKKIMEGMSRGVTLLYGGSAYTGKEKVVVMCAIKKRQIVELKRIVRAEDPDAFVIISETREVLGKGFEKIEI